MKAMIERRDFGSKGDPVVVLGGLTAISQHYISEYKGIAIPLPTINKT